METEGSRPIGVFDSGVGGLTVVKSLRKYLPDEKIIYFGDTARVPYGNKSALTVKRFSEEIMDFLIEKNVKTIIAACNTASSLAIPSLSKNYSVPVLGVINAGVSESVKVSKTKRIGVIGTNSTISSGIYDRVVRNEGKEYKLFSQSCPLFVPLVENRHLSDAISRKIAEKYLNKLKKKKIDVLILGCTHYPLLKGVIRKVMGGVTLIDSATQVAKRMRDILFEEGLEATGHKGVSRIKCYVSDYTKDFIKTSGIFLKERLTVEKVVL